MAVSVRRWVSRSVALSLDVVLAIAMAGVVAVSVMVLKRGGRKEMVVRCKWLE